MTAPFVIDLGFSRNEYAAIIKGVGLAATLIGGFAGGFVARAYPLADLPVDRRNTAGRRQPRVLLAGGRRPRCRLAHLRHRGGEFHQRHRHRDLRRLPLGAVQESAAHRDAIRAADGASPRSAAPISPRAPASSRPRPAGPGSSRSARSPACRALCCLRGCSGADISTGLVNPDLAHASHELERRAAAHRCRQRALVEIIELAADRHAVREPRHLDIGVLQPDR